MFKELIARIRGKKQQLAPPAPAPVPVGLFWYNVVQPGEWNILVIVINNQQREISRYRVWVN